MENLKVTMVGTSGNDNQISTGTTAVTPGARQPNLVILVVTPILALIVRFVHLFLVTLVGIVSAALTPIGNDILPFEDFASLVVACSTLALTTAALGLIKDLVTVFGKLEGKFPLMTGQV